MNLIMDPPSALLDAQASPLVFGKEAALRHLFEDVLGEVDVPVFVVVVLVLLRVLNFVREVGHILNIMAWTSKKQRHFHV